jgi:hypothetical protein
VGHAAQTLEEGENLNLDLRGIYKPAEPSRENAVELNLLKGLVGQTSRRIH